MEYLLLVLGFICLIIGFIGSFLPALPGTPVSWIGLLLIYLIPEIEINYWILSITFLIMAVIFVLDYIIPAKGTKKFGGSKYGIWGTNIGLITGFFFPPFGFIIGPFLGAFIGELIYNSKDSKRALKAALGSFLGFLASTFIQVVYCIILFILFFGIFFTNLEVWM